MNLLYLTGARIYSPRLREVNNLYRAAHAGTLPGVTLGGPGFDAPLPQPLPLPEYVKRFSPTVDAVFLSDPWHNFWDPCADYPNCPSLYAGIENLDLPVILESGDSQFYYAEIIKHLEAKPKKRAVAIRALSHRWRFAPSLPRLVRNEPGPPANLDTAIFYLPHGAYPEMTEAARGVEKTCDVLFSGSDLPDSYPARARIAQALRKAPDIKTSWLPHPSDRPHDVIGPKFWRAVAGAKIAVAGTNAYRNLTMLYLEIPASGALAIGDAPWPEQERDAWGEHMIDIGDVGPEGVAMMIREALRNPAELSRRTHAAREFVLTRHSFRAEWARVMGEIEAWIS